MRRRNKNGGARPEKKYPSGRSLSRACEKYFQDCEKHDEPLCLHAMILAINISRTTFTRYRNAKGSKAEESLAKAATWAWETVLAWHEAELMEGKNTTSHIFALKSMTRSEELKHKIVWSDKSDVQLTGGEGAPLEPSRTIQPTAIRQQIVFRAASMEDPKPPTGGNGQTLIAPIEGTQLETDADLIDDTEQHTIADHN